MKKIALLSDNTKRVFKAVTEREAPFALVIYWPWFYKSWIGLTIGFIVFTKNSDDVAHLCHELVHVEHFYKAPFLFWMRYFKERKRVGYWNNRYEKEAYAVQYKVQSLLQREAYQRQVLGQKISN